MSKLEKIISKILSGRSDNNIDFEELVILLEQFNFELRVKGSHHIFVNENMNKLINLQKDGKHCKQYQVKQVRKILLEILSKKD